MAWGLENGWAGDQPSISEIISGLGVELQTPIYSSLIFFAFKAVKLFPNMYLQCSRLFDRRTVDSVYFNEYKHKAAACNPQIIIPLKILSFVIVLFEPSERPRLHSRELLFFYPSGC